MANETQTGYGFGTFQGVFTPSFLTIIGVVMYLRFGWVLGNVGLALTLVIVTISSAVTFITGLSVSSLATNMRVRGGGAYYMLSRSLGVEAGAAIGIPLFFAQAISIAFYTAGFAEAFTLALPFASTWDPRIVGLVTLFIMGVMATLSADLALKTQYVIMTAIVVSLVAFFMGGPPDAATIVTPKTVPATLSFWAVLAVFFPAVTGILSGIGMSGDLKNPSRSLPRGTLAAVATSYVIYMAVPVALHAWAPNTEALLTDTMIFQKCARWQAPILLGVWAASLSSAIGCLLAAPRTLQALAHDDVVPRFIGRGFGATGDPRIASVAAFGIAAAGLWYGDINIIAPVLTMFYLTTYGLLNLSSGMEELMANPSWRPTFRVPASIALIGFAACVAMMFMISSGATFIAGACVLFIYWVMKRRALRARWGDMRLGLLMFGARVILRQLARRTGDERNWRPNLLVFAGVPTKRWHLIETADAISRNKSLITIASVIPEDTWTAERADSLRLSLRSYIDRQGIAAHVRIQSGNTHWEAIHEMIRAYGYGPIVPNTILIGAPSKQESITPFADCVRLLVSRRRNLIVVRDTDSHDLPPPRNRRIDVWWRGKNANGGFMLALACLVNRSDNWVGARLRLCHVIENEEQRDEVYGVLSSFLEEARVTADIEIVVTDGTRPPIACIRDASQDASLVFIGLRAPATDEPSATYGQYFDILRSSVDGWPLTIFALATENVNFQKIFRS